MVVTVQSASAFPVSSCEPAGCPPEFGYAGQDTGMMRARPNSSSVGDWEEFMLVRSDCSSDCWAIRSRANGRDLWVSAELGYPTSDSRYGMLRARAATIGVWEQFDLTRL